MTEPIPIIEHELTKEQKRAGKNTPLFGYRAFIKEYGKRIQAILVYHFQWDNETWWHVACWDRELSSTFQTDIKESDLEMPKVENTSQPSGHLASLEIKIDPTLPNDQVILVDRDGNVVGKIRKFQT